MAIIGLIQLSIIGLILCYNVTEQIRDTSEIFSSRQKRYLIFQEGVNWVQMVAGIGFPVEVRDESITWGATVKSYYLLPTNSNDFLNPSIADVSGKSRSPSRWEIYSAIRAFLDKFNIGSGKICLMRAICESALIPFEQRGSLLAEVVHVLLTPSTTEEKIRDYTDLEYHAAEKRGREADDCERIFSGCNNYFLDKITKIFT